MLKYWLLCGILFPTILCGQHFEYGISGGSFYYFGDLTTAQNQYRPDGKTLGVFSTLNTGDPFSFKWTGHYSQFSLEGHPAQSSEIRTTVIETDLLIEIDLFKIFGIKSNKISVFLYNAK